MKLSLSRTLWAGVSASLAVVAIRAGAAECLHPITQDPENIDPLINNTPVCSSVLRALNARYSRCDVPLTPCRFRPTGDLDLSLPKWHRIVLFDWRGREVPSAFTLLEKQIRGKVLNLTPHIGTPERQQSEVDRLLRNIREAKDSAHPYEFASATISVGLLNPRDINSPVNDVIYQLARKNCGGLPDVAPKMPLHGLDMPYLFLDRDARMVWREGDTVLDGSSSGVAGPGNDVFLYQHQPYSITTAGAVHVFRLFRDNSLKNDRLAQMQQCIFAPTAITETSAIK
jgi:hypothetical protein